jgi:hypothetical protein
MNIAEVTKKPCIIEHFESITGRDAVENKAQTYRHSGNNALWSAFRATIGLK